MCPPGYHHNSFMATQALGHMMYGYVAIKPLCYVVIKDVALKPLW